MLYDVNEKFPIGGSKILKESGKDQVTLIGAGVTLHECLKAQVELEKAGILARVIDCYSVKPIDEVTLLKAAQDTEALFVVEDHWIEGGIGDAVSAVIAASGFETPVIKQAVDFLPGSGSPEELLDQAGLSAEKIVEHVKQVLQV